MAATRSPIMYGLVGNGLTSRLLAAAFADRVARGRREYLVRTWNNRAQEWSDLAWVDAFAFTLAPHCFARRPDIPVPAL